MSTPNKLRVDDVATWISDFSKSRFGVAKLERPLSMNFYDQWLRDGYHGDMSYLERHRDFKADPRSWLPFARSALVFAIDYTPKDLNNYVSSKPIGLHTALYVNFAPEMEDYHHAIRKELAPILHELKSRYPNEEFRLALDAEPVLERDLAVRAGLGWVGKNTCIIDRNGGSLFFIAEILTSLETDAAAIEPKDFCGTCTRCIDACPTSALVSPRQLDATKCISYWTIESQKIPPLPLRAKFKDWFFGCDICQTVCPWNIKIHGAERFRKMNESYGENEELMTRELRMILTSSHRELMRRFTGTPLERARGFGLKRNALIVVANLKLKTLLKEVEELCDDEKLSSLAKDTRDLLIATT